MDRALKQRLVGASVLIALAVVVLPMMLGGRPESGSAENREIEIPPKPEELSFESRRFPVGERPEQGAATTEPAENTPKALPKPRSTLPTPRSETPGSETPMSETPGPETLKPEIPDSGTRGTTTTAPLSGDSGEVVDITPLEAPAAMVKSPPGVGRYLVQVASLGSADNANRLAAKLGDAGYAVLMDSVESEVGILNRVRVGPYASESDARAAAQSVASKLDGITPRVIDLQPEAAAPVTTPADPLVRWVVQVGSFSNADNAENLVGKLRGSGRPAYSETVTTATSKVHRVRVGPFLDREAARKAEREVNAELGLSGVVMSVD